MPGRGAVDEYGCRVRDQELAVIACERCPRVFTVRPRRLRDIAAGRQAPLCDTCRDELRIGGRPADVTNPAGQLVVDDAMRAFWAERFTLAEIVEIATASWGPPASWDPGWRRGFLFVGAARVAA